MEPQNQPDLFQAAQYGEYEGVSAALAALGAEVTQGQLNHALLIAAAGLRSHGGYFAYPGHTEAAQLLLDAGADPNVSDGTGVSALQGAQRSGQYDMMRLLRDRGAEIQSLTEAIDAEDAAETLARLPTEPRERGDTLVQAARNGRREMVRLLLDQGVWLNRGQQAEALIGAASGGHDPTLLLLLEGGADVNAPRDVSHDTALHAAVPRHRYGTVELLLDHGADINARGILGFTPLFSAVCSVDVEMTALLLRRGANTSARADDGRSVWDLIPEAARDAAPQIKAALLASGATRPDA